MARAVSPTEPPVTAIERARIAYELMMARQREAAHQRLVRERARTVRIVTAFIGLLMLVAGTAVYNGWLPTSLRSSVLAFRTEDNSFGETRTGHVRSHIKGNTCQELHFNNERGVYVSGSLIQCQVEVKREIPPPTKGARVNSIRDAFTSR